MKKYFLSLILLGLYGFTMILPYYLTATTHNMDAKNWWFQLHFGILHIPSVFYIVSSAVILHLSIALDPNNLLFKHKKLVKDLDEAERILEEESDNYELILSSKNSFLHDIISIINRGGMEEDITLKIQKKVLDLSSYYERLITEYGYIAAILPMLGMLGTITGLLQMFAVGDGVDNIAQKMAGLSVALATTLYATLIVILITKPKSREVETKLHALENEEQKLIMNAKLFLHNVDIRRIIEIVNENNVEIKKEESDEKVSD